MAFVGGVVAPPKPETVSLYDYFKRPRPVLIEEKGPLDYADDLPVLRAVTQSGVVISTGSTHSCHLKVGLIECFGDSDVGQTAVPGLTNPRQVSTGLILVARSPMKAWSAGATTLEIKPTRPSPLIRFKSQPVGDMPACWTARRSIVGAGILMAKRMCHRHCATHGRSRQACTTVARSMMTGCSVGDPIPMGKRMCRRS